MSDTYEKIERNKKPRVHIKYEIETENGTLSKELPFVVGVMGDFSADAEKKSFKDRKFIQVDKENFNDVMKKMGPELQFRVKNTLIDKDSELPVNLKFNSLDDFSPENIVLQVPELKKLIELREKLRELVTQVDLSESLEGALEKILSGHEPNLLTQDAE